MKLEPDGERMIVEHYRSSPQDYLIYLFHEASYRFAQPLIAGGDVLDLGCGSGYGSAMLGEKARSVVGVDVSAAAVEHARQQFSQDNVRFEVIAPDGALPFDEGSFDSVVCFQVIEHVEDDGRFVAEIARVLKPGGRAIIATPDRATRLFPGQKPWNRWHIREYSAEGLRTVLKSAFGEVEIQHMSGSPHAIDVEIARCARLKWLTLPFTLGIVPERLRFWGLSALRNLQDAVRNREPKPPAAFDFAIQDLWIGPNDDPRSVNLVALARKGSGSTGSSDQARLRAATKKPTPQSV